LPGAVVIIGTDLDERAGLGGVDDPPQASGAGLFLAARRRPSGSVVMTLLRAADVTATRGPIMTLALGTHGDAANARCHPDADALA